MAYKTAEYTKFFGTENEAKRFCSMKNNACRKAGNYKDIYAIVDGPEDNFAVVDLMTAITMGAGYEVYAL